MKLTETESRLRSDKNKKTLSQHQKKNSEAIKRNVFQRYSRYKYREMK